MNMLRSVTRITQSAAIPAEIQQRALPITMERLFGLLRMPGDIEENSTQVLTADESMVQLHRGSSQAGFPLSLTYNYSSDT